MRRFPKKLSPASIGLRRRSGCSRRNRPTIVWSPPSSVIFGAADGDRRDPSKLGSFFYQDNVMNRNMRVAVVGAGLGGWTAAGFLQRSGFSVQVYEQAPTFSRIGAGIILSANVTKVLRRLGVEDDLIAAGIKPHCYISRAWNTGETMYEIVFNAASEVRFGGPYLNIHRGDLHTVLERVVAPGSISFDHRLIALDEKSDSVHLAFENGNTAVADIVIGA